MSTNPVISTLIGAGIGVAIVVSVFLTWLAISSSKDASISSQPIANENGTLRHEKATTNTDKAKSAQDLEDLLRTRSLVNRELVLRALVADVGSEQMRHFLEVSDEFQSTILQTEFRSILV